MLDTAAVAKLREELIAADYGVDKVCELMGEAGEAGLDRNVTIPARDHLASQPYCAATPLIRLWILGEAVPQGELPVTLEPLVAAGLIAVSDGRATARLEIRPYGDGHHWIVADPAPGRDGASNETESDYVLGVSPASTTLANISPRNHVESALDLGTGCGVQAIHLCAHAQRVVATDINPEALKCARLTSALNQLDVDIREGSLYEPAAGETFDLIVTNPPYVMSPPSDDTLIYREGAWTGDDLMREVVTGAAAHLNPGGTLQVLGNWANLSAEDSEARLGHWVPDDCDALIVVRELLDVYAYIEMWLVDEGLLGRPGWRRRYQEWLAYFDALGVESVSLGWFTMRKKRDGDAPGSRVNYLVWPNPVAQPVGDQLASEVVRMASPPTTGELLASKPVLAADVRQETVGEVGGADPYQIIIRQESGLGRSRLVSTELAAVLGACDGELSLGVLISAVAQLLDRDPNELAADLEPQLRECWLHGFLTLSA